MAAGNPQTLKLVSVILKFIGSIPLLIGLCFFAGAAYSCNRQYTILTKWPTVDAQVTQSELLSHWTTFRHSGRTRVYQAHIAFQYTVDGKPYLASVGSDYSSSDRAEMQRKVDAYAPGTRHPIRYNPDKPSDARYDAAYSFGFFLTPLILIGVGLSFAGFGAMMFFMSWAIGRRRCPFCGASLKGNQQNCGKCGSALTPTVFSPS